MTANATANTNHGLVPLSQVQPIDYKHAEKIELGLPNADKILGGGLHMGSLVLVTGPTGDGKSTLCSNILCQAMAQGYKSLIYSGEMSDGYISSSMIRTIAGADRVTTETSSWGAEIYTVDPEAEAKIRSYMGDKIYLMSNRTANVDILDTLEYAVDHLGVRVALIDNLMTALPTKTDLFASQADFCSRLTNLVHDKGVLVILVAHPKKPTGTEADDSPYAISGDSTIVNLADVILLYRRFRTGETALATDYGAAARKLLINKNRPGGGIRELKGIQLAYEASTQRIHEISKPAGWSWSFPGLDLDSKDPVKPIFEI